MSADGMSECGPKLEPMRVHACELVHVKNGRVRCGVHMKFGCSCSRRLMDWQIAQREWRNCFLGFETSVLEPCVLVLRDTQQRYHGIIGVAVDDIAGGGDEVWEQAISKLKKCFTFGHSLPFFKNLDFVPLGKMRKEQSGDANETEKVAMR